MDVRPTRLWETLFLTSICLLPVKTNWPDFTPEEFVDALVDFAHRKRRFGGLDPSGK